LALRSFTPCFGDKARGQPIVQGTNDGYFYVNLSPKTPQLSLTSMFWSSPQ